MSHYHALTLMSNSLQKCGLQVLFGAFILQKTLNSYQASEKLFSTATAVARNFAKYVSLLILCLHTSAFPHNYVVMHRTTKENSNNKYK